MLTWEFLAVWLLGLLLTWQQVGVGAQPGAAPPRLSSQRALEEVAAWIFRGLKLIKELFHAFISLYLSAIYMQMRACH